MEKCHLQQKKTCSKAYLNAATYRWHMDFRSHKTCSDGIPPRLAVRPEQGSNRAIKVQKPKILGICLLLGDFWGRSFLWKGLIWGKSLILRCQKQMIELCLQDVPVDMYIYIYINRYVHGWKYNRQHRRSQRKRFGWACAILVWACDIFVVTPYFLPRYWGRSPWAKLPETR